MRSALSYETGSEEELVLTISMMSKQGMVNSKLLPTARQLYK